MKSRLSRNVAVVFAVICATGLAVAKTNTSTSLSSSANPSTYNSSVTFTATVTPSAATGTVTFKDGSTTLGSGTLSTGKATFSTSKLTAGSHSITAVYGGNTTYNGSTSSPLTQTVNKANSTVTLTSSLNPSTYGTSVKFTATVTPSTCTGTVTFKDSSTTLGTGTLASGKATFSTSSLTAGSHAITGAYGGDSNCNTSTSSTLTQTVNKAKTTTTLSSSSNPSAYGSAVTFTATISSTTGTGTVTFKDGTTTLGTGNVSNGTATYSTSTLSVGSHSITGVYSGDSNYNTSTSSKLTQTVKQASSITASSSTNPAPAGAPVTFIAVVNPSAATGTVTFMDGSTTLGTGTLSGGTATFTTSSLAVGSHSITAVYGGDSNYAGSTSPVLTESILTLTSIALSPQNASVPVGATQQFTATGTFSNGTNGNVTASVTWTSSSANVAGISTAGIATIFDEGPTTIQAALGSVNSSTSLTGTPNRFRFTGDLINARDTFTATVLQNGKVLIAGGTGPGASLVAQGEIYDPTAGTFSKTGNLYTPRFNHTATLLNNGMVLIAGGEVAAGDGTFTESASAELYDPNSGTFSPTSSLNQARKMQTATLLPSGLVLIAGGNGLSGDVAQAELYDPNADTFSTTGSLNTARDSHSATLLNDGTVLIAAGETYPGGTAMSSAEIYNPTAGTFTVTGSLNVASAGHAAALLNSGKVLVAAGWGASAPLARTELYDPVAKTFTLSGSLTTARWLFTGTLLSNGQVLFVGGVGTSQVIGTGELYDPTSGTTSIAGNLNIPRGYHAAAPLNNGLVLIAGGIDAEGLDLVSAETYQSTTTEPPPLTLQITPAVVNMVVGATQQFTAIDNYGYPRLDATWTVSNPSLATVVTNGDGETALNALAAGQVTLTASVEGVTAQAQITILGTGSFNPGTILWSGSALPGYSLTQLLQATPSMGGPDLFSIQQSGDGTQSVIQALKDDGEQLWQAALPPLIGNSIPDGFGGTIVTTCAPNNPMTVMDLGPTGQPIWQQQAAGIVNGNNIVYLCYAPGLAVGSDGTAYISEPTNAGLPSLTIASPTGYLSQIQFPPSSITNNGNTIQVQCCVGSPMVNSDGTAYVEYEVRTTNNNIITSDTLYLYNATARSATLLSSTTQNEALLPGNIIPDGQGGVLATWTISPSVPPVPQYPYQAADVSSGVVGAPINLPFSPTTVKFGQTPSLVLGDNNTVIATDATDTVNGPRVASFALASGVVNWIYQAVTQSTLSIVASASGGGAAINDSQVGVVQLDSSGNATPINGTAGSTAQTSVLGDWFLQNSLGFSQLLEAPLALAQTFWDFPTGGQLANGLALLQVQTNQTQGSSKQLPANGVTLNTNYNSLEILTTVTSSYIFQHYLQTFHGCWPGINDIATVPTNTNLTGTGQNLTFTMMGVIGSKPLVWVNVGQGPFSVQTERFDTTANTISVVTLQGHPLAGWRYWRVYSIGTNDLVVETGAADVPAPGPINYLGYHAITKKPLKLWQEEFEFILNDIRSNADPNAKEGSNPTYNNASGVWNPKSPSLSDILNSVCQSTSCN